MLIFGWREVIACRVHPGRLCYADWVPVLEQVELFPVDYPWGVDGGGSLSDLDSSISVSAVAGQGPDVYDATKKPV